MAADGPETRGAPGPGRPRAGGPDLRRELQPVSGGCLVDLPPGDPRPPRVPALPGGRASRPLPLDGRARLSRGHAAHPAGRAVARRRRRDSRDPAPDARLALAGVGLPPARRRDAGAGPLPLGRAAPPPDLLHARPPTAVTRTGAPRRWISSPGPR